MKMTKQNGKPLAHDVRILNQHTEYLNLLCMSADEIDNFLDEAFPMLKVDSSRDN